MTTRAQLRTAVSRDIRDVTFKTFGTDQVNDLIDMGINEVGLVYPLQMVEVVTPTASIYHYAVRCETAFRVEVYRDDAYYVDLDQADGSSQSGWDLHAGTLFLPKGIVDSLDPNTDAIRVWGYGPRARPDADDDVLELDTRAEMGVRAYARLMAYQSLISDRALYGQWQVVSKNTDVSINQLITQASQFSRDWDRIRNHMRTVRRTG